MATGISTIAVPFPESANPAQIAGYRAPANFIPEDFSFLGGHDATTLIADSDGSQGGHVNGRETGQVTNHLYGDSKALTSLPTRICLCDSDLIRTRHTDAILLNPLSAFTAANESTYGTVIPVKIGAYNRFCLLGYLNTVCTAIASTSPYVIPYLIRGRWDGEQRRFVGVTAIRRPDTDDYTNLTGNVISFNASPSTTTAMTMVGPAGSAGGWYISNPEPDRIGWDCRGYDYIIVLRALAHGALTGTGAKMFGAVELCN